MMVPIVLPPLSLIPNTFVTLTDRAVPAAVPGGGAGPSVRRGRRGQYLQTLSQAAGMQAGWGGRQGQQRDNNRTHMQGISRAVGDVFPCR